MAYIAFALVLLAASAASASSRIGTEVTISDYPSLAQIEMNFNNVWTQACTGIILTNFHFLSNAACFSGVLFDILNRRFRVGSGVRGEGGTIGLVLRATNHPSFGPENLASDLSVVRLVLPLILGGNIRQGSIIPQGTALPEGLGVNLVGWGTTAQGGAIADENLYSVGLFIKSLEECQEKHTREVTDTMICFGLSEEGGRDFDGRDLGAPVLFQNIVVSLLSFGVANGNDEYPVVGTSISQYTNWIIDNARF